MKERNCSLDMFRLLAAVLVVMCHTHIFKDVNQELYFAVSQQLPRFTVPFFFGVTGYYYIGALMKGKDILKKQMAGLMKAYIAWTIIYYAASFGVNVILGGEDLVTFLVERVIFFFTVGSYSHMWYMISLIYAVLITTIAFKVAGEKGICMLSCLGIVFTIIAAFGRVYYPYGSQIPVLATLYDSEHFLTLAQWFGMGIPYFTLGYFVQKEETGSKRWSDKTVWTLWTIAVLFFVAEIFLITSGVKYYEKPEVNVSVYTLTIMNIIVLLRNPMPKYVKQAQMGKTLSSFVYFSHPLVILIIEKAGEKLSINIHSVVLTILVLVITCVGGYFLSKVNWKVVKFFI